MADEPTIPDSHMKTLARRAAGDSLLDRIVRRTAGQNIVEYALLAAVLAIVVLGVIVFIGRDVSVTYGSIRSRLSSGGATAGNAVAATAAPAPVARNSGTGAGTAAPVGLPMRPRAGEREREWR